MKQTFEISGRLDGMNEYQRACRGHWASGSHMKRTNQDMALIAISKAQLKPMKAPVKITYTFYEQPKRKGAKLRDKDNIASFAIKVIQDALQEARVIDDDGWDWIASYSCRFYRASGNPRIVVEIEEA